MQSELRKCIELPRIGRAGTKNKNNKTNLQNIEHALATGWTLSTLFLRTCHIFVFRLLCFLSHNICKLNTKNSPSRVSELVTSYQLIASLICISIYRIKYTVVLFFLFLLLFTRKLAMTIEIERRVLSRKSFLHSSGYSHLNIFIFLVVHCRNQRVVKVHFLF